MPSITTAELPVADHAVCLGCGCLCDDIGVEIGTGAPSGQIVALRQACTLGENWYRQPRGNDALPAAYIDGKPVAQDAAVRRAAEILRAAKYPLVFGLAAASCEAQSLAAAIADRLGGVIDSTTPGDCGAGVLALQQVGQVSCTLGELRHRADVVVFWGCDPAQTHPRHFERYSLDAAGDQLTGPRTAVLVAHDAASATAARCQQVLQIEPAADFECLTVLRALVQGQALDKARVRQATGVDLTQWQTLCQRLQSARYGAIVFGSQVTASPDAQPTLQQLFTLVRQLNAYTRCVCLGLRGTGNGLGAENVLASRTGYPLAVDLSHGFPRFGPGEWQADAILARGEADAALVVDANVFNELSDAARRHLQQIPQVVLAAGPDTSPPKPGVMFRTALTGLEAGGSACRMDDVLLPLRPVLTSAFPAAAHVLTALDAALIQSAVSI